VKHSTLMLSIAAGITSADGQRLALQ